MLGVLRAVLPSAAYAQTWPRLVSLWTFDDVGALSFADIGPANVAMTVAGTWAATPSMVQGVDGASAYTNGSAHATIPADQSGHDLSKLTISFYYQRNSEAAKHILLAAGDGTQAGDFSIEVLANGRLRGYHVGQDNALRFFGSTNGIAGTNLEVGTAHRIDVTFGSLGARIYLDGAQLRDAFILANRNGWNNSRIKYLGVFTDGVSGPANGAFDGLRIWDQQLTSAQIATLEPAQSSALPGGLPLIPAIEFLASDGTLPASNLVYVYDTSLGNGSGSSPANAREIQAALNASVAGQTLVAIAASPGGKSFYNRTSGLAFSKSGTSGNPITLMARTGDTVVIDRGQEFAAYRSPSSSLGTRWELFDAGKHIWRSVANGFGSTVRPLGGVWFEGGWPHYILPCDSLAHLQAGDGLSNIWTNYGGPAALVHTDGRIYLRWEIPFAGKMSVNNKWPIDGRLDYMPGWISKTGGTAGRLNFPATQDPRDYEIWLAYSPGGGGNAGRGLNLSGRSWVTIGEGINTFGYGICLEVGGLSNVTIGRGTDIGLQYGIVATGAHQNGPLTLSRRRMSHGVIKHQPLVNWKFGGPLEASWRGSWAPYSGFFVNSLTCRDCTFHGWHDFCVSLGAAWDIQQCTFVQIMDDGFQVVPSTFHNLNLHYCYFLDSVFGGPEQSGNATGPWYISHNIFDNRCPRLVDCTNPQGEPFFMPLMQTHYTGGAVLPLKWFNNTIIFAPDNQGADNLWQQHVRGDVANTLTPFHEVFNNIWVRSDYQRYTGTSPSGNWAGRSDEIVSRCICGGASRELYDYEILHRDVPGTVSSLFHDMVDTEIAGGAAFSHGAASYASLAAWLASAKFTASKGIYSPGFFANAYQVDPQIPSVPSGGSLPDFDMRRNYRPAAAQAGSGFSGATNSPAGESTAGWAVKPSSWIGALDPNGSTTPIGVQNP